MGKGIPVSNCLCLLSGGQDSTTCLFWAKAQYREVHALTINYGQRHALELLAAERVAELAGVASYEVLDVPDVLVSSSPLTDHAREVEHYESVAALPGGIEKTFVPARNIFFLTLAANRAVRIGTPHIVIGVSAEDYGGYPDCREPFLNAMNEALSLGIYGIRDRMVAVAPLLRLTKAQTVLLAQSLGKGCWDALAYSHTCYDGEYPPNPHNHASLLRAKGFAEAGFPDPLIVRAKAEGLLPEDYPDTGLVEKKTLEAPVEEPVETTEDE